MIPPPGIIGPHVHIQGVIAIGYQKSGRLKAFFNIPSFFLKRLFRKRPFSPVFNHTFKTETQRHRKILPAPGFNFLHNFSGKTKTIFKAAAILVISLIKHGNGKLIQKITFMDSMNLHTVKASSFGIVGTVSKRFHNTLNFVHGQRPAHLIQPPVRNGGRGNRRKLSEIGWNRHPSKARRHHKKHLTSICVYPFRHFPGSSYKMNRIIGRIGTVGHALSFDLTVRKSNAGNNQSGSPFGPLRIIINSPLIKSALSISQTQRSHRCHGKSIFQLHTPNLHRCK